MKVRLSKSRSESDLGNIHQFSAMLRKMPLVKLKNISVVAIAVMISACSAPSGLSSKSSLNIIEQNSPEQWQANKPDSTIEKLVADGWLKSFNDETLEAMVTYALENNYQLTAERIGVEIAKEKLNVSAASDFHELSLSLDN